MSTITCGNILISDNIEFSFACTKCTNIFESFRDYQIHILEEHIKGIFGDSFNELLEVEFTDDTPIKLSDSEAEEIFIETKKEKEIKYEFESLDLNNFENTSENKFEFENKFPEANNEDDVDQKNIDDEENEDNNKGDLENKDNIQQCRNCDKIFYNFILYKKHIARNKCGKCPVCKRSLSDIWSHISKFHRDYYLERKRSGLAIYERPLASELYCDYCDRKFKKEGPFRVHIMVHEKSLDKCKYCGKYFKGRVSLATHIRTHTGERPFKCPHCPVAFSDNANLKTHVIIKHTEGLNAKCRFDGCNKTFKTKELRNRHERYMHEDKRDHLCLSCGIPFKTSSKLDVHIKMKHIEYEDRPYKCSLCSKKYIFKRDFNHHMMMHTGEKPYKCEICLKAFRKKYSLTKHNRLGHS